MVPNSIPLESSDKNLYVNIVSEVSPDLDDGSIMGLLEDSEKIEISLGFGCDMIHSPKETLDNGPCEGKLSMEMKALGSVSPEKDKPERLLEPQGQAREFQVIQLGKENGADCGDYVPVMMMNIRDSEAKTDDND